MLKLRQRADMLDMVGGVTVTEIFFEKRVFHPATLHVACPTFLQPSVLKEAHYQCITKVGYNMLSKKCNQRKSERYCAPFRAD